mmetsp:Transcript_35671/g.54861  ORF Transcript_35671/g.54861 Transcript_35671/m.54861 type:complete len:260 (+) Transcript_35671:29-808(+)
MNPIQFFFPLSEFFPRIGSHIPEHFAHESLVFAQVAGQLVRMQKETDFADRLLQFFFVGRTARTFTNIIVRNGFPFAKVIMGGNSEFRWEYIMDSRNELVNGSQHLHRWWEKCPVDEEVSPDRTLHSSIVVLLLSSICILRINWGCILLWRRWRMLLLLLLWLLWLLRLVMRMSWRRRTWLLLGMVRIKLVWMLMWRCLRMTLVWNMMSIISWMSWVVARMPWWWWVLLLLPMLSPLLLLLLLLNDGSLQRSESEKCTE